jgi:hypothetical protein
MAANSVTESYNYNVICKVCDVKLKASEAKKRWDGLHPVCSECWEPRHPMDFYRTRNDNHRLPFTSPDAPAESYGMFPVDYEPPVIVLDTAAVNVIMGNRFTALTDGYISSVRYWHGPLPASGHRQQIELSSPWFSIFDWTTGTLLWRTSINLNRSGQWLSIPVTPNLAVTSGTDYLVAITRPSGFTAALIQPPDNPAAQTYADYVGSYFDLTLFTRPTTIDAGNTYPLDVTIRPT